MLNNEFPPLGGGTGTVNQAILQRLSGKPGLEIDLITSALGNQSVEEYFADNIRIFKVPVNNHNIHHSSNRELIIYAIRALLFALRKHHRQPYDFCFAWSAVPAGGVALVMHWLTGLPYLVRVGGPDIPGFERRYGPLYPLLTPVIRAIWHGAEGVVAKCKGEEEMILAVDRSVRIAIVPNGVDLEAFQPGDPIPDDGPLRLLCVGRLIERKGQHHLIEAVKQLTDEGFEVTLDLVGMGDSQSAYQAQAQRLGVTDRVRFVGYVPKDEIAAYYASTHVFVLPSYNEGMSVATLEAMATGLPIVITRTGGTAELVEEGANGLTFNRQDLNTLKSHLRRLAGDHSLARQMGMASRRRAERFTWDMVVIRYQEMFEQIFKTSFSK